jgi:hypothetical protein
LTAVEVSGDKGHSTQSGERIASRCICCDSNVLNKSPAILMPFIANRTFGWQPVEITDEWGLRDIKSGMAYPLCNSVQCAVCGALFLDIRFSESEMSSLYSGYRNEAYTDLRDRFEPGYRSRNAIILGGATHIPQVEAFLSAYVEPPLRILDWGGDTGVNTPFKSRSDVLHIYDISNKSTVQGASRVKKQTIANTIYDLIVLSHVLEHVPYPATTINEICSVMGNDTVLYIEVPHEDLVRLNPGSHDMQTRKKHWHEHINFFTRESLHSLLERCGLQAMGMQSLHTTDDTAGDVKQWHVFAIACKLRHA